MCTSPSVLDAPILDLESSGCTHTFMSEGSSDIFAPWPEDYELEELDTSGVTNCYDELMELEPSNIEEDESGSNDLPGDDSNNHYQYSLPKNSSPLPIDVPLAYQNHDPHKPDENRPNPFHINFPHPIHTPYPIT